MVWPWNMLMPKIKQTRHHLVSLFAVKCRKKGHFQFFRLLVLKNSWKRWPMVKQNLFDPKTYSCQNSREAVIILSFFAVKCRKNGHFHSFSGCECLKCMHMHVNSCKFLEMLTKTCKCLQMLAIACECLQLLANACNCLQMLANACNYLWVTQSVQKWQKMT